MERLAYGIDSFAEDICHEGIYFHCCQDYTVFFAVSCPQSETVFARIREIFIALFIKRAVFAFDFKGEIAFDIVGKADAFLIHKSGTNSLSLKIKRREEGYIRFFAFLSA